MGHSQRQVGISIAPAELAFLAIATKARAGTYVRDSGRQVAEEILRVKLPAEIRKVHAGGEIDPNQGFRVPTTSSRRIPVHITESERYWFSVAGARRGLTLPGFLVFAAMLVAERTCLAQGLPLFDPGFGPPPPAPPARPAPPAPPPAPPAPPARGLRGNP